MRGGSNEVPSPGAGWEAARWDCGPGRDAGGIGTELGRIRAVPVPCWCWLWPRRAPCLNSEVLLVLQAGIRKGTLVRPQK